MRKILWILFFICIFSQANAYTYIQKKVNGVTIRVMEYHIDDKNYALKVATSPIGVEKPVRDLLKENNMISGVNWVFFCPSDYSFCADRPWTTNNERYVAGEKFALQENTWDRVVFAWDKEENPFLFQSYQINANSEENIEYGISNWPLLLHGGRNMVERYYDLWLIDSKMNAQWTRNFICSTQNKKTIYYGLVYWVTIDQLVWILAELGCFDALNLDAGASTSFVYNNRHIVWPGRDVIDVIGIERVWLNTANIYKWVDLLIKNVIQHTEKRTKDPIKRKAIITRYIDTFTEFRISTYDTLSTPLYEKNVVGEMDYVGYEISIKNARMLEIFILVNEIVHQLQKYRSTL